MCKFLDFMDSPSYTYMKWPLGAPGGVNYFFDGPSHNASDEYLWLKYKIDLTFSIMIGR